jgi:hypothetical protein
MSIQYLNLFGLLLPGISVPSGSTARAEVARLQVTDALSYLEDRESCFAEKLLCPIHPRTSNELKRGNPGRRLE